MKEISKIIFVGMVLALMLLIIKVEAAGLSMGPLNIVVSAVRGGKYEKSLHIYNPGSEPLNVLLNVEGNATDFIYIYPKGNLDKPIDNITIPASTNSELTLIFKIPEDTPTDGYSSTIFARAFLAEANVGTGVRLSSNVNVYVAGAQHLSGSIEDMVIEDTEINHPLIIRVYFKNQGNVIAKPSIDVNILKNGNSIDQFNYEGQNVGVGMSKMEEVRWNTSSQTVGDYVANVKVYLEEEMIKEENLSFKILERGILTVAGSIVNFNAPKQAETGSVEKIVVGFMNTGQIDVLAKVSGEVFLNNKIVDTLESDEVLVGVGKVETLTAYFKPTQNGTYLVKGNVVYEGKKEPMSDISINVGSAATGMAVAYSNISEILSNNIILIVFIVIVIIIFVIVYFKKIRETY